MQGDDCRAANIAVDRECVRCPPMTVVRIMVAAAPWLLSAANASAQGAASTYRVGDAYEVTKSYTTSSRTSDNSTSSSSGHDTIEERVIAVHDTGVELDYDLANGVEAEERARHWEFPARILRPSRGPTRLLNAAALQARLAVWLKAAGWDRSVCGRWIFTWNAFRIECDPYSVIQTIGTFDLDTGDLHEGAVYRDPDAVAGGTVVEKAGATGPAFVVALEPDPNAVRRARAEADVATGEIMRKPVTLDAALRDRAKEIVSGRITVTLELDAAGAVRKRTKETMLDIALANGTSEHQFATEVVERRRVSKVIAQR